MSLPRLRRRQLHHASRRRRRNQSVDRLPTVRGRDECPRHHALWPPASANIRERSLSEATTFSERVKATLDLPASASAAQVYEAARALKATASQLPQLSQLASEDRAFGSMPKGFPTLFANGDLPEITASGIAPEKLRAVPWQARPAVARAPSTAEAFSLLEKYGGDDGETLASIDAEPGGPAV
jgi:hypothetical protein